VSNKLQRLATDARNLADELLESDGALRCHGAQAPAQSCLHVESERALNAHERHLGWVSRPFSAYDHARMCGPCRAYWFQAMAANAIADMEAWERYVEARTVRKRVYADSVTGGQQ